MKQGEEPLPEVLKPSSLLLSLLRLLLLILGMTTTKLFTVSDAYQVYCPECFVPSPRTTRNRTIAKTTMSAYTTMTKHPSFPYVIDKQSDKATPTKISLSKETQKFANPELTELHQLLQYTLGVYERSY